MLNIIVALAFATSWMLHYSPRPTELVDDLGLPLFQIMLVLIPALIWFAVFKTTTIYVRLKPNKATHSLMAIGNVLAILNLGLHIFYTYQITTEKTIESIVHESMLDRLVLWSRVLFPISKIAILAGVIILFSKLVRSFLKARSIDRA